LWNEYRNKLGRRLSYYARKNELALSMQSGTGVCCCGVAYKIQHVVTLMALSSIKEGELMLITRTQVVLKRCSLECYTVNNPYFEVKFILILSLSIANIIEPCGCSKSHLAMEV
jgi:hypothetical protein